MQRLNLAVQSGLPILSGPSRKGFIGRILAQPGTEPPSAASDERMWGTAAAVCASIAQGADIVRVHDVAQMKAVARVGDAVWRNNVNL